MLQSFLMLFHNVIIPRFRNYPLAIHHLRPQTPPLSPLPDYRQGHTPLDVVLRSQALVLMYLIKHQLRPSIDNHMRA